MKLKQPYGWFAAGREVRQAMEVLSDGTFKLYMHLCLYADRETGSLAASRSALARAMRRDPDSIHRYLEEMRQKGVARLRGAECSDGVHVEICGTYWPYQTARSGEMTERQVEFAGQVRLLLAARRCVAISFSPADEKLAKKLR